MAGAGEAGRNFATRLYSLGGRIPVAMVAACPFPANRGTPIRIEQMAEALAREGYQVHVVTYHLGQQRPVKDLHIHRIRGPRSYQDFGAGPNYRKLLVLDPLLVRRLLQVVRAYGIRVIHAHHFEGAICALAVKRIVGGVRVIYDAHTTLCDELPHYDLKMPATLQRIASAFLDSAIPRWCDHIITVSESLRNFIREQGVPDSKITVIPMAVNVGDFPVMDRQKARKTLALIDGPTVLYTGSLERFQGIDQLLRSMVQVRRQRQDARLIVVGKPTFECRKFAKSLGLDGAVTFAGEHPFETVRQYLAAADVVVLPRNNAPGFPLKLLNYMAAGRPIVAFHGSSKEVLEHAINGYVVQDGDEEGFAGGILKCLADAGFSERMASAALHSAARFSQIELDQRLARFYRSFVGAHGAVEGG